MFQKITYKWPVDNFFEVAKRDDPEKVLKSPEFALGDLKLRLLFEPTNQNSKPKASSRKHSSLYLEMVDFNGDVAAKVWHKLWFENNCGKRIEKPWFINTFDKNRAPMWGYSQFVKHDELYSTDFIKNDFLFICCTVEQIQLKHKFLFKWPIYRIFVDANRESEHKVLESRKFLLGKSKYEFTLRFRPTNESAHMSSNFASLFLCAKNLNADEKIGVKYTLWIENNRGKKIEKTVCTAIFDTVCDAWGIPEFVYRDIINESNFARDDYIFLCCKMELLPKDSYTKFRQIGNGKKKQMSEDCTVRVGNLDFKVAKNLLIEHSDLFYQLLLEDKQGSNTGIIEFDGMSPDTFKKLVMSLYHGKNLKQVSDLKKLDEFNCKCKEDCPCPPVYDKKQEGIFKKLMDFLKKLVR